jgi:sodium transport system ATP-binding protein
MIEVKGVTKEYVLSRKEQKEANSSDQRRVAVSNVSFTCHPGRVFSLLGPNGAGKTTILRMIASILSPTQGSITVGGHDTQTSPNAARRQMGFLTGSTGLYDRLTVNEVLKYFADLFDVSATDFKTRQERIYSLLDMHGFANKRCGALSTGMKQKVSIARTMIHDPQVVVFDEPTSGLDVISAENIINLVHDLRSAGKTVIFSSHNMSEVDLLADDLAIIHHGKLVVNGTMEAFRSQMQDPSLTKEFIRIIKGSTQQA